MASLKRRKHKDPQNRLMTTQAREREEDMINVRYIFDARVSKEKSRRLAELEERGDAERLEFLLQRRRQGLCLRHPSA